MITFIQSDLATNIQLRILMVILFRRDVVNIKGFLHSICGPPPMMDAIEKQLADLKIDEKLIIKEVF